MKHAYMIMAHNQVDLLKTLLKALDYEDNDIVVHIDAKSDIDAKDLKKCVNKTTIYFTDRKSITWGGYSQIDADIRLLKMATSLGNHCYYHLLTGVDLPIKPIQEINLFFEENQGKEFINYSEKSECIKKYGQRVKYNHYFREKCGRSKNFYTVLNKSCILLQKILHFTQNNIKEDSFYFGSAFWDITEDLAQLVLDNEEYIRDTYKYSSCCDEVFLHTLVWNSEYRNKLFKMQLGNGMEGNMRWIDMERGENASPYVIKEDAIEEIVESGMLFARKFDMEKYPEAVDRWKQLIK